MNKIKEFGLDAARRWFFANMDAQQHASDKKRSYIAPDESSASGDSFAAKAQMNAHGIARDRKDNLKHPNIKQPLATRKAQLEMAANNHLMAAHHYQQVVYNTKFPSKGEQYQQLANKHGEKAIAFKTRAMNLDKAIARGKK